MSEEDEQATERAGTEEGWPLVSNGSTQPLPRGSPSLRLAKQQALGDWDSPVISNLYGGQDYDVRYLLKRDGLPRFHLPTISSP